MTDTIEHRLRSLAEQIPCPDDDEFAALVMRRISARFESAPVAGAARATPSRRRMMIAIVAVVATVLVVPGPRYVIARWFGFNSVRVEWGPVPTTIVDTTSPEEGAASVFGPALTARDAATLSGLAAPMLSLLGEPQSIHVVDTRGIVQIVVVYPPGPTLPPVPIASAEVTAGALVSVFSAELEVGFFGKFPSEDTIVEALTIDGHDAIWLAGEPHTVVVMIDDSPVTDTLRLATNTLLYQRNGLVLRIEADISRDEAISIARTWEPTAS